VIDGDWVRSTVFRALYVEAVWPQIVQVLAEADGGDYRLIPPNPAPPSSTLIVTSTDAIVCNDSTTRRPGLDYLPTQLGFNTIYPRFGGLNFGLQPSVCSAWPQPEVTPLRNATTRHPIVLIGNDFDPATPMPWTRNMAAVLQPQARLVRYRGGGHIIYASGSPCIDGAINAYFRDLTPPPSGLTCPGLPLSFGAGATALRARTMAEILPTTMGPKRPRLAGSK
jgi:pimeloyl-ACP methyl ester carboxylesterase